MKRFYFYFYRLWGGQLPFLLFPPAPSLPPASDEACDDAGDEDDVALDGEGMEFSGLGLDIAERPE